MQWRLDSELESSESLERHIEWLLLTIENKAESIRELSVDYDLTISCIGRITGIGHGLHLGRDLVRQAARLGIAFDFDYYCVDPGTLPD